MGVASTEKSISRVKDGRIEPIPNAVREGGISECLVIFVVE